jgi:hypothetical protein
MVMCVVLGHWMVLAMYEVVVTVMVMVAMVLMVLMM